tara:strand:+ start:1407 stop:2006 length:600 start_codon:yes stop_codon:yes gene_type:complete
MTKLKKNSKKLPDPTRGKTRLIWEATYEWTVDFFNNHPELKIGAEIGVAGGQHIKSLMKNTKIEKIYGIDPYISDTWDMDIFFNVEEDYNGFDGLYDEVKEILSVYGNRVELIRKKSLDAAVDFEDETLDFVFVDGAHDYENCYNDINYWHNRVRSGGYVMGHDWEHHACPGVQQAVVEHYGDSVTGISGPYHIWYVKK